MYFYKINNEIIPSEKPIQNETPLTPNTTDGAYEKHVPVIEQHGDHVTVKVGCSVLVSSSFGTQANPAGAVWLKLSFFVTSAFV